MQHPRADRHDQPGLLGDLEEVGRFEQAELRVLPTHERLDPDHLGAGERDDRLVVHAELAAHERPPQRALDLEAPDRPVAHRLVEQLDPAPPELLGREHRDVGVAQQPRGRVVSSSGDDDADARAEEHLVLAERERLVEHGAQPVRERQHVVDLVADVVADDRELVAAEAGEPVAGAQHPAETPGRGGEQLVAGFVAETVVHDLEVVDVEQHESDPRTVLAGTTSACCSHSTSITRFGSSVSGSWRVRCASSASMRRCSLTSYAAPTSWSHAPSGPTSGVTSTATRRGGGTDPPHSALERDGAALVRGPGERADVGDECVRGHDVAQVAGRLVVAEQPAVRVVRVDEAEDVARRRPRPRRRGAGAGRAASCRRPPAVPAAPPGATAVNETGGREDPWASRLLVLRTIRLPPCHVAAPQGSLRLSARRWST